MFRGDKNPLGSRKAAIFKHSKSSAGFAVLMGKIVMQGKKLKPRHLALLAAFTLLASTSIMAGVRYFSSQAAGNACVWTGTTDTNWDTPTNWSNCNSTFPDTTDAISFSSAATNDLIMTATKTVVGVSAPSAGAFNKTFNTNNYALTVNGDFTWQKSTLTLGASDVTITGNLDVTAGTFNYNTSNFILTGNASTITPKADNSLSFYNLTINKAANTTAATIQTSNFNVRGILNIKKGMLDGTGRTVVMPPDWSRYQISPDSGGGSAAIRFTGNGYVDASGGTANDTIELAGAGKTLFWNGSATLKSLTLTDGTLNLQSGKLTFPASADGSAGKLSCAAGKTLTMAGTAAGSMVILRSDTPGSTFYLENNCAAAAAAYVDIKDANNTSGTIITSNSIDSGNNTGFDFATTPLAVNKWISDTESNWNNAANWSIGHVPTSTENVYFGQGHNGNCIQDVVAGVTVANIISADYTGTFNGGSSNITISASLEWTSGIFTSTSGTLSIAHSFRHTAGIFNHNSGTVTFFAGSDWNRVIDVPSLEIFNNMSHNTDPNYGGISIANGDTLVVDGTLNLIAGALYGGTIDLNGTISNAAIRGGNTLILIDNPGQTLNISDGWVLPGIDLRAGTLNAPVSGTMTISGSYLHSGGTFNNSLSTIGFTTSSGGLFIDVPTNETFFNLSINTDPNYGGVNIPAGHVIAVSGTLSLNTGCIFGGSIDVNGSLTSSSNFKGGNTNLLINNPNQTINIQDGWVLPTLNISAGTVNAPSGLMTIISGNFIHSGGTFNHNSGTLKFVAGYPGRLIDVPGSETLNNLIFDTDPNYGAINIATDDLLIVSSKLTLTNGTLAGGAIEVKGDLEAQSGHDGCTTAISLTGTTDQTYILSSGVMPSGNLTINKPSGKATITGTGTLKGNIALTAGQLDFAGGSTYTMAVGKSITASAGTRLNFNGSVGNLVTFDSSDASTAINITKPDGIVIGDYVNMNHTIVSGGAKFYSTSNFTGANNTGWTTDSANLRTISAVGGNWSDPAAWNEGAVPTNADNVLALSGSGNITVDNTAAVAKTVDLTNGYANTLTLGNSTTLTVSGSVVLAPGRVSASSSSTLAINATGTLISAGNTLGGVTTSVGTVTLGDNSNLTYYFMVSSGALIADGGVGSLTHTWPGLGPSTGNVRTVTLGNSTINITSSNAGCWNFSNSTGLTFNADTSTINFTAASNNFLMAVATTGGSGQTFNIVNFTGAGSPGIDAPGSFFSTLTRTGTSVKTDGFILRRDINVTGTFNLAGNSVTNRLLVNSQVIGTARTITAANVSASNVDFMDITAAGAANWDLSGISGGVGDCGGNTGITFTPGVTQTWTNAAGGNWSDVANWSGRVPLPQDDVNMARVGGYNSGVTVTADMPRLGKSIDWTGATWTGTATKWTLSTDANACYGNLTLISNMTLINTSNYFYFSGRSSFNVTSAGKELETVVFSAPGGQYTLTDALRAGYALYVDAGSFVSAGNNINVGYFFRSTGLLTRSINISESVVTITANNPRCWDIVNTGLTMTPQMTAGSTLVFPYTGAGSGSIRGGSITYDNISFAGGGGGTITFEGSLNFSNLTMSSPGTKTVKFTKDTTYTMTGTNFLSGSAGNLVTIDTNDGTGTFTLNKTSGMTVADYVNVSNATVQGGAKWYLTPNSTQTNCTGFDTTNNNIRTVSAAGGNWDATTTWNEGVVPAAADEVYALPGSGNVTVNVNAVARNLNFYNYLGTLTHNAATSISVGDASGGYLNFAGLFTYTKGDATTSALAFVSTNNNSGNGWPITWGGKTPGNITFDGAGGKWIFSDSVNAPLATATLTKGTWDTGNQTLTLGKFYSNTTNARTWTLGSSSITFAAGGGGVFVQQQLGGMTFNAGTSSIYFTGSSVGINGSGLTFNNVIFSGGGSTNIQYDKYTFANLSILGTAVTTDNVSVNSTATWPYVVTGTLTLTGNSAANRLLVKSSTLGSARPITAANVNISNVDFMDIAAAGAANWDLSAISGGSGDCGGNTGITFTPGVTQTWTNAAGGNWSTASNWSGRVPLPQDDVSFAIAFQSGKSVVNDMPRQGKTIDWSGATWAGTPVSFNFGTISGLNYGGLIFKSGMTWSNSNGMPWYFAGRGNFTINTAGISFGSHVYIIAPGGTYSLASPMTCVGTIYPNYGSFVTAGYNLSTPGINAGQSTGTRVLDISNSLVTISGTGDSPAQWALSPSTGLTLVTTGSTIFLSYTGSTAGWFLGGAHTYNNIQIAPGSGATTFSGAFTFNNMTMSSAGAKTVKFTKGTTYTMTGSSFLSGTSGNLVTIDTNDGTGSFTINKTSGATVADYVNISRNTAQGGATFYLTSNSTQTDCTGWTTNPANIKTISAAGGNWDAIATWNEGAVPTAADAVFALPSSGNATINVAAAAQSVNFRGYLGALTHNAATALSVGDANGGYLDFAGAWTYTLGNATTSAINFVSTNNNSGNGWPINWGGKTPGNITINGSGGSWIFKDALNASATLTLIHGNLNTNSQTLNLAGINSSLPGAPYPVLTLGSSVITLGYWMNSYSNGLGGFTLNADTSTFFVSTKFNANGYSYNNVIFNGAGTPALVTPTSANSTFANLSRIGTLAKTDGLEINSYNNGTGQIVVNGTLNIAGNSSTNRLLIKSDTLGTARTITAANVVASNVDLMDITAAGAANWDLSAISGGVGDCGGNTGITFTPGATQTWSGTAGGNWSTNAWSGRVPLPQDDVNFSGVAFTPSQTVDADMPRLGKSIDWTGATGTPTWRQIAMNSSYGNITLISSMAVNGNGWNYYLSGRSSYTITSANTSTNKFYSLFILAPGGTYTLADAIATSYKVQVNGGNFNSAGFDVTCQYEFSSMGTIPRSVNISNSTVTLISDSGTGWWMSGSNLNFTATGSTVKFSYSGASATNFTGGGYVYNNIQIVPGAGVLAMSGAFTFNSMTMSSAGTKTVKFTKGTTYTMTGTNFLSGSAGNLVTIDTNDGTGTFTLNKTSGMTVADYVNVSNATVQGGAKWYLTPNSTQTNCTGFDTTNNNIRTVSAAGGNWDATTTWNEGVVPAAADEVYALPGSGNVTVNVNAVARNLNFYNYLGTLTHNAATSISVGDASGGYLNFAGPFTYTKGDAATSSISFVSTNNNGGNGWPITWGGKAPGNITFNAVGGKWIFQDGYTNPSAGIALSAGELNTNGASISISGTSFSNSSNSILTLGSSNIIVGGNWNAAQNVGWLLNGGTSTITTTGSGLFASANRTYNNVVMTGANPYFTQSGTFANLTRTGNAVKTDTLQTNSNLTITDTLTLNGNSTTNRILFKSDSIGTPRTITAANVVASNVDFQDITAVGAAGWDLSGISGGSGDCGGNTGITFTSGVTQTWTNAAGGNWSTASNWSGRVPLPQDDVSMARAGGYTAWATVSVDMPRLGKSIDWTGATWNGTAGGWNFLYLANGPTIYGSLTLNSAMTFNPNLDGLIFSGRSSHSITSAGKSFYGITIASPNGTYTLRDSLNLSSQLYLFYGTLDANDFNVTCLRFLASYSNPRALYMGNGSWTLTQTSSAPWEVYVVNFDLHAEGSTIVIPFTGVNGIVFEGSSLIYNNIAITPGGTGAIRFSGNFSFNNMTMAGSGTRNVKFTKDTTYTMTGTNFLSGSAGNLVTIDTNDGTGTFTLNKTSGMTVADYVNVSNATVQGGAKWYLTPNSTQTNCTGFDTTNNNIRTVSAAGGNWDATTTWNEGVVPAAADEVYALPGSGNVTVNVNAVARNLNFYNYLGTLTHNAATSISVGDASGGYLNFAGNWTYTLGNVSTSELKFVSTSNNSTNGWPIYWGGKVPGSVTFNGGGGKWVLYDQMISSGVLTVSGGAFLSNDYAVTALRMTISTGVFEHSSSTVITLNGAGTTSLNSNYHAAAGAVINCGNPTFSAASAALETVNLTSSGIVTANIGSAVNLTRTGTALKTDELQLNANLTISGTLSMGGESAVNRLLVKSNTIGTARTITAANVSASNVDFMDIATAGAANWDLSGISGGAGDCGGNTGITFTPGVTQTWTNAVGGSWSTAANWSGRVPLPQDDVNMARIGGYNSGVTVNADMPRLGKSIDWTGATWTGTATTFAMNSVKNYIYGSLSFVPNLTYSRSQSLVFCGRGSFSLTSAGRNFGNTTNGIFLSAPGGSLTLQDNFSAGGAETLGVTNGTFDANGHDVYVGVFSSSNSNLRTINMGSGRWSISCYYGGGWNMSNTTNLTFDAGASTLAFVYNGANPVVFEGGNLTYNDILITPGGAGVVRISGVLTFRNMTMASVGTKFIRFAKNTTYTMTGSDFLSGTAGNLITIYSDGAGESFTLSKASGIVVTSYDSIKDANVTGGAKWYMANTSVDATGNTGWLTDSTAPTSPNTITANVGGTSVNNDSAFNLTGTTNINFSGASDPDSGLVGYFVYFGADSEADPVTYQAHSGAEGDTQSFSTSISEADNGKNFYFRLKTKDAVGNIGTAVTLFHFQYDKTAPIRPSFVAATPAGYTTVNNFSFTWPAGSDPVGGAGASGIKWYEYKRNVDAEWSHTADAASRTVSNIESYQEGANVFLVRTIDNSDNISDYTQVTYYYSGSAPAKPTNVSVSPETSDTNEFTISWDKSTVEAGDPPVVGYYYSINAAPTVQNITYIASQAEHISIGSSPFATKQGLNTIYILGVNAAGNLSFEEANVASATFTCVTPAPPTPTSISLYDSSDRGIERWMLTTQWLAGTGQDATSFDHYSIERSTNGSDFSHLANSTSNAYIDAQNLDNATTYSYRIKAVDSAGKESAPSSIVARMPSGKYTLPPTNLSAPRAAELKSSAGTISWITDRASTSIVRYGTKDGDFTAATGTMDLVTSHAVTLLGLSPNTLYYYQTQSLDEDRDYTPDNAYSETFTFTTGAAPAISETSVGNISLNSADISFNTTTVANSTIHYGTSQAYGAAVDDTSGAQATNHRVKLTGLTPGTTYHFKIKGTDIDNNVLVSDDYQFDTLPLPNVTDFKIEAITNVPSSSFKASWTTNVPTSTILKYKTGNDEYKESVKTKSELNHSIEISNLSDSSEYSVIAAGRDTLGNLAESDVKKFTTPFDTRPARVMDVVIETSNVGLDKQDKAQIAVSWKTDEPTTSMVEYGEGIGGPDYNSRTQEDKALTTNHLVIISNLTPKKPYHIRVVAVDKGNNISNSDDHTVIPGDVPRSALQIIIQAFDRLFGWMKL